MLPKTFLFINREAESIDNEISDWIKSKPGIKIESTHIAQSQGPAGFGREARITYLFMYTLGTKLP